MYQILCIMWKCVILSTKAYDIHGIVLAHTHSLNTEKLGTKWSDSRTVRSFNIFPFRNISSWLAAHHPCSSRFISSECAQNTKRKRRSCDVSLTKPAIQKELTYTTWKAHARQDFIRFTMLKVNKVYFYLRNISIWYSIFPSPHLCIFFITIEYFLFCNNWE